MARAPQHTRSTARDALVRLRDVIDAHLPATDDETASAELSLKSVKAIIAAAEDFRVATRPSDGGYAFRPAGDEQEGRPGQESALRRDVLRRLARALRVKWPETGEPAWISYFLSVFPAIAVTGGLAPQTTANTEHWDTMYVERYDLEGIPFILPALTLSEFNELGAELLAAATGCFKRIRGSVLRSRAAWAANKGSAAVEIRMRHWIQAQADCGQVIAVLEHWLHSRQAPAGDKQAAYERTRFLVWALADGVCQSMTITRGLDDRDVARHNQHAKNIAYVLHTLKGGEPVARHALLRSCIDALQAAPHHFNAVTQLDAERGVIPQAYDANLPPTLRVLGEICRVALAAQPPPPADMVAQALSAFAPFSGRLAALQGL